MRRFRAALALIAAAMLAFGLHNATAADSNSATLIAKSYEYGFPIFEHARLVYQYSYSSANPQRVPVNSFGHRRQLVDHTARAVTTPNNDTLYSSTVIDLSAGPVRLDVPDFGSRYYSIAFLDAYTNNFAYLGTRVNGGKAGSYRIVSPDLRGQGKDGGPLIRPPNHHIIHHRANRVEGPGGHGGGSP